MIYETGDILGIWIVWLLYGVPRVSLRSPIGALASVGVILHPFLGILIYT